MLGGDSEFELRQLSLSFKLGKTDQLMVLTAWQLKRLLSASVAAKLSRVRHVLLVCSGKHLLLPALLAQQPPTTNVADTQLSTSVALLLGPALHSCFVGRLLQLLASVQHRRTRGMTAAHDANQDSGCGCNSTNPPPLLFSCLLGGQTACYLNYYNCCRTHVAYRGIYKQERRGGVHVATHDCTLQSVCDGSSVFTVLQPPPPSV